MLKGFIFWRCMLYISTQSIITKCDKGENHVIKPATSLSTGKPKSCGVWWNGDYKDRSQRKHQWIQSCPAGQLRRSDIPRVDPKTSHPQAWPKMASIKAEVKALCPLRVLVPRPSCPPRSPSTGHPGLSCHIEYPSRSSLLALSPPLSRSCDFNSLWHTVRGWTSSAIRPTWDGQKETVSAGFFSTSPCCLLLTAAPTSPSGDHLTQSLSSTQAWHQVPVPITVTGLRMGILCLIIWFQEFFVLSVPGIYPRGFDEHMEWKKLSVFQGSWADWVTIW